MSIYRRVYVLGSGFSKAFCPALPTLKDLNALLPEGISDDFPHWKAYCERMLTLCSGFREVLDIESLATSVLSAQIFPHESERISHAMLRFELLRFIASSIRFNAPPSGESEKILRAFLKYVSNSPNAISDKTLLLSFNYDTLLEETAKSAENPEEKIQIDFGFRLNSADRKQKSEMAPSTVDLIKLHGSLDWFLLKGVDSALDIQNVCRVEPLDKSYPMYEGDTPVFIPMAHSKGSFLRGSLFNVLWAKADYYLREAEEIIFIGYGFPKSDINNLEFLLQHGNRISEVVVFEEEGHPELSRLKKMLGESRVVSCDAKEYVSKIIRQSTSQ